jgi:hypothetical protein
MKSVHETTYNVFPVFLKTAYVVSCTLFIRSCPLFYKIENFHLFLYFFFFILFSYISLGQIYSQEHTKNLSEYTPLKKEFTVFQSWILSPRKVSSTKLFVHYWFQTWKKTVLLLWQSIISGIIQNGSRSHSTANGCGLTLRMVSWNWTSPISGIGLKSLKLKL